VATPFFHVLLEIIRTPSVVVLGGALLARGTAVIARCTNLAETHREDAAVKNAPINTSSIPDTRRVHREARIFLDGGGSIHGECSFF